MKKRTILYIFLLSFCLSNINAQKEGKIKFYTEVPEEVLPDTRFQLHYVLEGAEGKDFDVAQTKLENVYVLYGPSTSSSVQSTTNPKTGERITEYKTKYTYMLQSGDKGTITIPEASIDVNGKKLTTKSKKIKIVESKTKPKTEKQDSKKIEITDKDIFIKTSTSKRAAGIGDPIEISYTLYIKSDLEIENVMDSDRPRFSGFRVKREAVDDERDSKQEKLNGKTYNVIEIAKYTIYPQDTGSYPIEPYSLTLLIDPDKKRDKSGMTQRELYNSMIKKTVSSEKIRIVVGSVL
ncbi:BatD family protein [Dysgonomonas sp. 520]|uniref:BatD family protein n=1 Tax=Dysgonomonas sp. 520 TaxID=2302931 RepID=UPI0013D00F9C|nr:BatD family protein [Dysgonomonas sp. 520]NDW08096.1 hypothetical protein [Dysgonomonas sp. 520]